MIKKLYLGLIASFLLLATPTFAAPPVLVKNPLNQLFYNPTNSNNVGELRAFATVAQSQNDSALVAAVTGKVIRVVALLIIPAGTATTSTLESATTAISGAISPAANTPVVFPYNPAGWFQTASGEALNVDTGAGSNTVYQIVYVTY